VQITIVTEADLDDLLPLTRAYGDFYEVAPSDDALRSFSRLLLADPAGEGVQLLARDDDGAAIGYATLYWSLSSLSASRIAIMDDLFVREAARGAGVAEALIEECRARARRQGATTLNWQTARTNLRAQRVYQRVGARRAEWLDYSLEV
jgi:GNAT superfamily N-acetyltransferase